MSQIAVIGCDRVIREQGDGSMRSDCVRVGVCDRVPSCRARISSRAVLLERRFGVGTAVEDQVVVLASGGALFVFDGRSGGGAGMKALGQPFVVCWKDGRV